MNHVQCALGLALSFVLVGLASGCNGDDDPTSPDGPIDTTAPAAVTDLHVATVTGSNVTFAWTAPGDDEHVGTAAVYRMRVSSGPVTEATWETDVVVADVPAPLAAGTVQTAVVDAAGMNEIHAALKTADEAENLSPLSNVAHVSLTAPFAVQQMTTVGNNSDPCVNDRVVTWVRSGAGGDEIYWRDLGNTIGTNTRLTGNGGQKNDPSNVGSAWVVWTGRPTPNEDWEIYFDDMSADLTCTRHTENDVADVFAAATNVGNFVWVQGRAMYEVIRHYDSGEHRERTISEASCPVDQYASGAPATDFGVVVWRATHRGSLEHKVVRYTTFTDTSEDLSAEVGANTATDFSVDGGGLAYETAGDSVAYWDGSTARTLAAGQTPSLHAGRIAYVAYDGDYEIHYWDGATIHEITDNDFDDAQPCLFGDLLVWVGRPDGGAAQIFYVRL